MREVLEWCLDACAAKHVTYADGRFVRTQSEAINVVNGDVTRLSSEESVGLGVRVLVDGAWGFAATSDLGRSRVEAASTRAIAIARAASHGRRPGLSLGPPVRSRGHWQTPFLVDPFTVPLGDKLALLCEADDAMARVSGIRVRQAMMAWDRHHKFFGNTEGAFVEQTLTEVACALEARAEVEGRSAARSYPDARGHHGWTGGYEHVLGLDLVRNAPRIAEEAVRLCTAPAVSPGRTTVVLDGSQMAIQLHESLAHAAEHDRILGQELSFAGGSFIGPEDVGRLDLGNPLVNVWADATTPGGLGTYGFDDEGVPAGRFPLFVAGRLEGLLGNRETAALAGHVPGGVARAAGWNRLPLIRMPNIHLEPGDHPSLEALIADVDEGIYMATNQAWSIDDRREDFRFGTEIAWEIRKGRLGRMLSRPGYQGRTQDFWRTLDALGGPETWNLWSVPHCGKGQPRQFARVSHGTPAARFRDVKVGA
ncbi:MAG: TldD/PmbA family protein [Candidatus Sericytochromatia bacterium]|nr:TldD/PmbA family protein [Candidatus Tanganyikabacteria bacterium]